MLQYNVLAEILFCNIFKLYIYHHIYHKNVFHFLVGFDPASLWSVLCCPAIDADVGPTLTLQWVNVVCLLGGELA